ncbi:MAG: 16S rRNA (guanine(527)-N(7))-methyltransferase RsmG [Deltaproteobacteria bacterium]|nr:MAG: 16S rRNA (guanine(527)-N(7))-methyltransferase RsmG [Deltaproteobacteria bacterium]RLC14730.1 MAG: 16S rRNA (guanine(527)-N(7))-methyltransferase RsmG [Deltaproteobacteria bacterium]
MYIGTSEWKETIVTGARSLGIDVQPGQADQFAAHALILKEWNQKINLTAIDSPIDMAVKHFLDSIISSRYIKPDSRLLDVGSGAGFPGIPLKVMMPSLNVILVDATRKKISFLKHVIQALHLSRIAAIHSRIEDLQQEWDGRFDIIVCRAFSSLADFAEKCLPLLAPDGLLLAFKGKEFATDLDQASTQKGSEVFLVAGKDTHIKLQMKLMSFKLPYLNLSRTLILLRR